MTILRTILFLAATLSLISLRPKANSFAQQYKRISKQDSLIQRGERLFEEKCASCHHWNMRSVLAAPALKGTEKRWKGDEEKLYAFIKNSQAVIKSGHKYAKKLYQDWGSIMPPNPDLTHEDIAAILAYIKSEE
jgi:mono/diheme cytochrome c family protein